jgi:cell division protein FtsL
VYNVTEDGFVFIAEYNEPCSEVAVSYTVLLVLLILLLVIFVVALTIIVICMKYRRQYYTLLNEKEVSRDQEQTKEVRKMNNPFGNLPYDS